MSEQSHFQDEIEIHLQDVNLLALLVLFFLHWWVLQKTPFIIDVHNFAGKHFNSLKMPTQILHHRNNFQSKIERKLENILHGSTWCSAQGIAVRDLF